MNYHENLGARCDLLARRRSPYPPKAWLEMPSSMYPVVNDPERCRFIEEETRRLCREKLRKVNEFHSSVCERIKRLSARTPRDCDLAEPPVSARVDSLCSARAPSRFSGRSRSLSPEFAFLEGLPGAHSVVPVCTVPRLPTKPAFSEEERHVERLKSVRATSANREREQARQWREQTVRKQQVNEAKRRQHQINEMAEEARLETQRIEHLKGMEQAILEKENKLYATELKRLIATRLLRRSETPVSNALTLPYDSDHPFGMGELSPEVWRLLRRLPPLCPCHEEWFATNPDKCSCSLRDCWTECAKGLEKLMSICVHGEHCF